MSGWIPTIVLLVVALAAVPVVVLSLECLLALIPDRLRSASVVLGRPTVAVVVPAHNEQCVIEHTIATILPQLHCGDRLLVIADNCTDQTAQVAAKAGAQVIERHDTARRGKGFALAAGMAHLHVAPPAIVVVIDADCAVASGAIDALVGAAVTSDRPIQALDLMDAPTSPTAGASISAFAFLVKNLVRPLGCSRLGIPCLLRGTGMAFPWNVIRDAPLASANIVEDLQLGIDVTFAGYAPVFCPEARVTGQFPADLAAAEKQRRRWEHGHLRTITSAVLPTIARALRHRRLDLLLLALDIAIPPLSLLILMWVLLGTGLGMVAWFGGMFLPLGAWCCGTALLVAAILGAWIKFGRGIVSARTLARIPLYVLGKIPLYWGYVVSPQKQWVRTDRIAPPDTLTAHSLPGAAQQK